MSKELKLKDQGALLVSVPGLGLFKLGQYTEVSDDRIKAFEAQEYEEVSYDEKGEMTVTVKKRKVSDMFDVRTSKKKAADDTTDGGDE